MSNGFAAAFKKRSPSSFADFKVQGATVAGPITEVSDQKQATKWNPDPKAKRELDFWPSGDPVMEVWITVQTQERNPEDPEDTGLRMIVVTVNQKQGGQLAAIMDACEAAGVEAPAIGGFLALTFTHFDPESKNPQNPRKIYAAQYRPPAAGGGAFTPQAQPQQQAPQYNEWNPAPAQQAPVQHFQGANAAAYPTPEMQASGQAAPPAWAQPAPAAPAAYAPPTQVNPNTGEIAAPAQAYAQPAQAAPAPAAAPAPQAAPAPGAWDATAVQQCIAAGMDDATISQTTGAPAQAVAAIRAIS